MPESPSEVGNAAANPASPGIVGRRSSVVGPVGSRPRTLVYLANSRLPTEKAHGHQIARMCAAFAGQGIDVTLLHPGRAQPAALEGTTVFDYYGMEETFQIEEIDTRDVHALEPWLPGPLFQAAWLAWSLRWAGRAAATSRASAADVAYTRDPAAAWRLARAGRPFAYEAHGIPRRARRRLLRRALASSSLRLAVALTTHLRQRLVDLGAPPDRTIVAPDAVDLDRFRDLPARDECRRRLGLPRDARIVGYIGRWRTLGGGKGVGTLVRAVARLDDACLVCVGGPMDAAPGYRELAAQVGLPPDRLRLEDRVPPAEVPLWIRACDVATIPWPWTEHAAFHTSPLKLFEYMAAGAPIVASDLPSLRDILAHGENAWFVEPGDPDALAEGIATVLGDPDLARTLAAAGEEAVKEHTWTKRAARILGALATETRVENVGG